MFLSIERRSRTLFGGFNRRPGDTPEEANWEGWTPPWLSREGEGPRGPFGPGQHWGVPDEFLALRAEAAEVARLFAIASRGAIENKERLSQLRALLDRTHKELSDMIFGSAQQGQATSEGGSASSPTDIGQA